MQHENYSTGFVSDNKNGINGIIFINTLVLLLAGHPEFHNYPHGSPRVMLSLVNPQSEIVEWISRPSECSPGNNLDPRIVSTGISSILDLLEKKKEFCKIIIDTKSLVSLQSGNAAWIFQEEFLQIWIF